jgi:maltooligosyltrehalose trehalohydrolase
MKIGANYLGEGRCEFCVWSPSADSVELEIVYPVEKTYSLEPVDGGYWKLIIEGVFPGARYFYRVSGFHITPDPASFSQPEGVHECSEVIELDFFRWNDMDFSTPPADKLVIYELHTGTFTDEGTFDAIIPHLDSLKDLGVNAIELMPVTEFAGKRNWGYDTVYPFAVHNIYGGAASLQNLVNHAHKRGICIFLDVIYNHIGPEGNYFPYYAPYFTKKYKCPWGKALNFDDENSMGVRNYFLENVRFWFEKFHIDGLRLDAVHQIYDSSNSHILAEISRLTESISQSSYKRYLIAESDLNNPKLVMPVKKGGYGLDMQWLDDFHHSLHTLFLDNKIAYFQDYGGFSHLSKAYTEGFVYSGQFSQFRGHNHGKSSKHISSERFVVFNENHDQAGNRLNGERLSTLLPFEAYKLNAAITLLSPYIPMLFMGEEYFEDNPFLFFVDFSDPQIRTNVVKGRNREFARFWKKEPPDPLSEKTFLASKLDLSKRNFGRHKNILEFYKYLLKLRREIPSLYHLEKKAVKTGFCENTRLFWVSRRSKASETFAIYNLSAVSQTVEFNPAKFKIGRGDWVKLIESADEKWGGNGAELPDKITSKFNIELKPFSFALYELRM